MKFGQGKRRSQLEYSTFHWTKTQMARQQERANIACSGGISYNYLARSSSGTLAKEMMAQWLRGLTALPEELGSIPHNSLYF